MDVRKGKQQHSPFQLLSQTFRMLLLGSFVLSIIFTLNHLKLSRYFPIKTVRVYGVNHVDRQEVQALLLPLVNHGFFTVDIDYIRDRLQQLPWASQIFVRRDWPNRVDITIVEKDAVASWNGESLLSTTGELFSPKQGSYPQVLPKLIGPDGKQIIMLQYFSEINRILQPLRANISYLELTPYLTWKLVLNSGITLQIGHKDILTRLDHFVKVYPKIIGNRVADVDYIDLRYPNGLAVRWKAPVKPDSV